METELMSMDAYVGLDKLKDKWTNMLCGNNVHAYQDIRDRIDADEDVRHFLYLFDSNLKNRDNAETKRTIDKFIAEIEDNADCYYATYFLRYVKCNFEDNIASSLNELILEIKDEIASNGSYELYRIIALIFMRIGEPDMAAQLFDLLISWYSDKNDKINRFLSSHDYEYAHTLLKDDTSWDASILRAFEHIGYKEFEEAYEDFQEAEQKSEVYIFEDLQKYVTLIESCKNMIEATDIKNEIDWGKKLTDKVASISLKDSTFITIANSCGMEKDSMSELIKMFLEKICKVNTDEIKVS